MALGYGICASVFLAYFMFFSFHVDCEASATKPCNLSRNVFNTSWGVITDGPSGSNYTQDSHCEWLIEANNSRQFITLSFRTMGTECSYDYLFVYDGNSYKAPLLGSFSGKTEPQQVIATSGAMLILLYSDTNYVLDGFQAEFSVTDCRNNCSQHGTCVSHTCVCDEGWGGRVCNHRLCPDNCGEAHGRGKCNKNQCVCTPGYSGQACSLHTSDTVGNKWHWLSHSEQGLSPRAAHTAIYDDVTDALYVFGGYDLNRVLSDLAIYWFSCSCWKDRHGNPLGHSDADVTLDGDYISAVLQRVEVEKEEQSGVPPKSSFFRQFLFTIADNSTFSIRQHEGTESPNSHIYLPRMGRENKAAKNILSHPHTRRDTNVQVKTVTSAENQETDDDKIKSWLNEPYTSVNKNQLPESTYEPTPTEGAFNLTTENDTSTDEFELEINSVDDNTPVTDGSEEVDEEPEPRYGHAACRVPGGFVLYGGKLGNGSLSDELWLFNMSSSQWSLRALRSPVRPPNLTRHTLTLAGREGDWLYLFGGSTIGGEFLSRLFRLRLEDRETEYWTEVFPRGGKELDMRVVAHSTVYHRQTNSLLVYGGVVTGVARFSKLSDRMFAFQLDNRHWTEILYPRAQLRDTYVPRERAFHTSTIIGNYLVVFGGYSHRHNKEEICYDNQMYLYHLGCHTWVSHEILGAAEKTQFYPKQQGVFAHAAAVAHGNTLLIVGGYHGNVNADLLAYTLPPTLATPEGESFEGEQMCSRHRVLMECTANPECGWCSADEICYGRTVGINCTTNLQTTRCPGICPALGDCHACLIHGAGPNMAAGSVAHKLRLGHCTWCVQNARCHHKDDNYGVCGLREDTPFQVPGYWGTKGTEVVQVSDCRILDRRPGLTFLKYHHPANFSQPDSVTIINATTVDYKVPVAMTRTERNLAGQITARLLGFLRPPVAWAEAPEFLLTCASYSSAVLTIQTENLSQLYMFMMSTSDFVQELKLTDPPCQHLANICEQVVANLTAALSKCDAAKWPDGRDAKLSPGRYLVDFKSHIDVDPRGNASPHQQSKMELLHAQIKGTENAKVFTFEYLEPYSNGSCHTYTNCLQCLTDSQCGWCSVNNLCLARELNETEVCLTQTKSGITDWHYLTLVPASCDNCSNFISCETCVHSGVCEWWVEEALCMRRHRDRLAVVKESACPVPCHLRSNCSQCLDARGRCVWCDAMQQCFAFSVYTSEYQFGLCRQWLDQRKESDEELKGIVPRTLNEKCKSCSRHANCSDCLKTLSCGWCYNTENPIEGVCSKGDFNQPYDDTCSSILKKNHPDTESCVVSGWAYAQCPDVDECDLKLDKCHPDALCTNTRGSYVCQCKRGFLGDGKQICAKTCYHDCIHGYCTGAPQYVCKCNLGWTGEDCGTSCGCNNHSTCGKGVCLCDECQDWTEGEFCEYCRIGSYGNATVEGRGCHACDCNGHGNQAKGVCDMDSGVCFCQDNTEGVNCERCKKGYYGDPRGGGMCYYQCVSRGMLTGMDPQGLGSRLGQLTPWESRVGAPPTRECLWVVSPHSLHNKSSAVSLIQFTIHDDINISCQENSLFVYDGLPDFVSTTIGHQRGVLGVFCSQDTRYPITVEAKSGVLTVYYKQGDLFEGFNASYKVLNCPEACDSSHTCQQGQCMCADGFMGTECLEAVCPNNCSYQKQQGVCDKDYGRCICAGEYGGLDCSVRLESRYLVFTHLFDSHKLADSLDHLRKTLPRFGHSLVADRRGALWMFGGYSLSNGPLNDIRLFDTKNNTWLQVTIDSTQDANMPQRRYFHAAEIVISRREIYVYGGLTQKEKVVGLSNNTLNDFWKFDLKNHFWCDIKKDKEPPPLAGHTLTFRRNGESESLVLLGGFSPRYGFLDSIWEFDLRKEIWNTLETSGSGPLGVYGHSTVYHTPTQSFYVFGGYMYSINRTFISNKLYAFYYPSKMWSVLPTMEQYNPLHLNLPRARFLHSAVTTDSYMFIFGGRTHPLNTTDSIVVYAYTCNLWLRLDDVDIVGSPPPPTFAHAMALDPESKLMYIIGGFDGTIQSHVTRIKMPKDLCGLWEKKDQCLGLVGCSYCAQIHDDGYNASYCYSNDKPVIDECANPQPLVTLNTNNGIKCDSDWVDARVCEQYQTCSECLAQWPAHLPEQHVCKWCSNCQKGRCVPESSDCKCNQRGLTISNASQCPERKCPATDCDKCLALGSCVWTRQVMFSPGQGVQVAGDPVYDWNCVPDDISERQSFKIKSMPPSKCPSHCSEHTDCHTCLSTPGAEGGWHECRWSIQLNECVSPSFQPLYCAGGVCGLVLLPDNIDKCPEPCSTFKQCSTCLRHAHCGWCSFSSLNSTGQGICSEGSLDSPSSGPSRFSCEELYLQQEHSGEVSLVVDADTWNETVSREFGGPFSWHYVSCPPENECLNDHHTCDSESEQCVDLVDGFHCVCAQGYSLNKMSECVPVCAQGCVRGECVQPNNCLCEFGYVGANCSIQCQCHGHSNCEGPDKLDHCIECHNNTKGAQCEKCKPLFVGDPSYNIPCVPCIEYCNGHTHICINDSYVGFPFLPGLATNVTLRELEDILGEGPTTKARCIDCKNRTAGDKCEKCISGNFRGSEDARDACRPCECHGHGDTCDPVTGERCDCQNNTESDASCTNGGKGQQCWMVQCSKCREHYTGSPTAGHQCYRHMMVDAKFCFDAMQLDECESKPKGLYPGQTVFFVVQPRFMNVDIRVIVDVTQGGVDLFLSPRDDTFVVGVNASTGAHVIETDPRYHFRGEEFDDVANGMPFKLKQVEFVPLSLNTTQVYVMMEQKAVGLTTFITVLQRNTFLVVRNVQDRLVLTLPQDRHDLGQTRFYLVLTAASSEDEMPPPSRGMIFFRQDQLHIDLFVFFSVFFSCFFLFLAACVVAWKAKQAADVRRARRRHVVEMLHMAKRPFASVTVQLDGDEPVPNAASPYRKKRKQVAVGDLRPVAVEPTDDGVAAVGTVFVRLPGGTDVPVKLALASSLILLARVYPLNGRAFLRRRSSHAPS